MRLFSLLLCVMGLFGQWDEARLEFVGFVYEMKTT